jgi:hypothetical protein
MEALIERQHLSWADTEIPLLGGKTPREMVRTAEGRARVAAMINDWEHMHARVSNSSYRFDFNKLRAELRIAPE